MGVAEHRLVAQPVAHGAVHPGDGQRSDEYLRDGARVGVLQQIGERACAHMFFARQARAVRQRETGHRQSLRVQEALDDLGRLRGRGGRLVHHGADRQKQIARHHVVAELVDVANDVRQRGAVVRPDEPRAERDGALVSGALERPARLAP